MNHIPKISIITPSYNQGQYIEQSIQSVLNQQYPNLEYIIIDGGSTDNSVDIIKKYEEQISFWVSEKDRGQSHALCKGIIRSTGDIVQWINSDDYLEPGALHALSAIWKPEIKCILGKSRIFSSTNSYISQTPFDSLFFTFSSSRIDQPATWFSGNFMRINLPDETLHLAMDLDLWYKFLLTYTVESILTTDAVLVNFREHEDAKSNRLRHEMRLERALLANEVIKSIYLTNGKYSYLMKNLNKEKIEEIRRGAADFILQSIKYLYSSNKKLNDKLMKQVFKKGFNMKEKLILSFILSGLR